MTRIIAYTTIPFLVVAFVSKLKSLGVSSDIINDKSNPSVSFNIIDFALFQYPLIHFLFQF